MRLYTTISQRVAQSIYLIFAGIFSISLGCAFFFDAFWKSDTWFARGDLELLGMQNPLYQTLGITLWLVLLYGVWKASEKINQSKNVKTIIPAMFLAFLFIINLFIQIFPVHAYDDALVIRIVTNDLMHGNFISFLNSVSIENKGKNYLYLFPLQVPYTLYTYAIHSIIGDDYTRTRIINTLYITATSYTIYQIYLLWQNKKHEFFSAFICTTFIPFILLGAWVYNDFPAMLLSCISIYFFTVWQQQARKRTMMLSLIALAFANLFRPIALLLALSFALIIVLRWIKSGQYKPYLWILFGLFIAIQAPHKLVNGALALGGVPTYSGFSTSAPAPKWMWLNIGYDYKRLGVWSYNEAYSTFVSEAPINEDEVNAIFKHKIAEKWHEIGLSGTLTHLAKKTFWQWTEGTYQSIAYGIGDPARPDYYTHQTFATQYANGLNGESFRHTARRITQLQNWLYLFAATVVIGLAIRRRHTQTLDETLLLLACYTLMVFGMYLLWETKSRYILSSTIPLLLLASFGLPLIFKKIERSLGIHTSKNEEINPTTNDALAHSTSIDSSKLKTNSYSAENIQHQDKLLLCRFNSCSYKKWALLLLIITGMYTALYMALDQSLLSHSGWDSYILQAQAWWNGRTMLEHDYPYLELAIFKGQYYVSFPPIPTIPQFLLYPFFGENTPNNALNTLYTVLSFALLTLWFNPELKIKGFAVPLAAVFGSNLLAVSLNGGVWFQAQILAFLFTTIAFFFAVKSQHRLWAMHLSALCLALAVGCRPFQLVYFPALLWLLAHQLGHLNTSKPSAKTEQGIEEAEPLQQFLVFPILVGGALAWYNWLRFGNPIEFGHNYLPEFQRATEGQFSLSYIPQNFMQSLRLPSFTPEGGLTFPRMDGVMFFLVNPIFLILARKLGQLKRDFWQVNALLFGAIALHMLSTWSHRTMGGWQFGNRYFIDMIPAVVLLLWLNRCKFDGKDMILALFGIGINVYGALWLYLNWP